MVNDRDCLCGLTSSITILHGLLWFESDFVLSKLDLANGRTSLLKWRCRKFDNYNHFRCVHSECLSFGTLPAAIAL